MSLLQLMITFFFIGLFTIGGGLVAITLMYEPIVGGGLLPSDQFYNMIAISESTPGPMGINMATYIGYEMYGVLGGILTTFATVLPSLIIVILVAKFLGKFQEKPLVKSAFTGLRPAVAGMILVAMIQVFVLAILNLNVFKESGAVYDIVKFPQVLYYILATAVLMKTKLSPIWIIFAGAVFGVLFL